MCASGPAKYGPHPVFGRVVVAGASMSGLLAATVLAPGCEQVLVLDRDHLPDRPVARRGAGQARHAHALLATGVSAIEDLLPGSIAEMLDRGARRHDTATDITWVNCGSRLAVAPSRLEGLSVSRVLLEHVIRRRVAQLPNVHILPRCTVTGIRTAHGTVCGATMTASSGRSATRTLPADLVVDATGRASRLPRWLTENGYALPSEERMTISLTYTSRIYPRPPDQHGNVVIGPAPVNPRAGALLWLENDRWHATLAGYHGDQAPLDPQAFTDYAASLPSPLIADILGDTTSLEGPYSYRIPANRWRRYDLSSSWPDHLLCLGDSACVLNPVYGQGITVAALQARLLRDLLAEHHQDLAHRFRIRAADIIGNAWSIAVFNDNLLTGNLDYDQQATVEYLERFHHAAATDPTLAHLFLNVINLREPATRLTEPTTAANGTVPRSVFPARHAGLRSGGMGTVSDDIGPCESTQE
jgi:2-polyprenyl-6-methoxyphenol hydroxylase-like FAD-dependent oxidoreductase